MCLLATSLSVTAAAEPSRLTAVKARLQQGDPVRIVCFGDSITGVYYHSGGIRAWCDMLGLALQKAYPYGNIEMVNAGISGHTTVNALARIESDVLAKKPDLVVVMFGMNDVTRVPLDAFTANTRNIVDQCEAIGAAVVLCTPNSVIENGARPNKRLAEFSAAVREVAEEKKVLLVDTFQAWDAIRQQDENAWRGLMSDSIHPNMNGHRRFAEIIATEISGRDIALDHVAPPHDTLQHTFDRLQAKQPISMIAMQPYDELFTAALRKHFPAAQIEVTPWPTEDTAPNKLHAWAGRIRGAKANLVIPAIPASEEPLSVSAAATYELLLNLSLPFAGRNWDLVPVARADDPRSAALIRGKDVRGVKLAADASAAEQIKAWVDRQHQAWQGSRESLPAKNGQVFIPTQPWPQRPGLRTVRATLYYPGGKLSNVNQQTGVMLTLHNWGGEQCAGTANPQALADRLNVVGVCVDYLQSGRKASIEDPQPYDFGVLQGIDALTALHFVRQGLKQSKLPFDDGRLFCTGGSGGGNVTLMANKLAPRTFACVIDMCGMAKLSDDIAFNLPGGTGLNARWSRDPKSANYLSPGAQELRFNGNPDHLETMTRLGATAKVLVVHGATDSTCPIADAREMIANMQAAKIDVEPHIIDEAQLDGKALTSTGHPLGNRTEIVFKLGEKYLAVDGDQALRRSGPSDFDRQEDIRYETSDGEYVVSYAKGYPRIRFAPNASASKR